MFDNYFLKCFIGNMEQDIVNGISLSDFIKKYGKEKKYLYYKIIKICEQDLK